MESSSSLLSISVIKTAKNYVIIEISMLEGKVVSSTFEALKCWSISDTKFTLPLHKNKDVFSIEIDTWQSSGYELLTSTRNFTTNGFYKFLLRIS